MLELATETSHEEKLISEKASKCILVVVQTKPLRPTLSINHNLVAQISIWNNNKFNFSIMLN